MKKLKKQRSISPRKIKGYSASDEEKRLFKSVERLSSIHVRHQHNGNPDYTNTLKRIAKQLEDIKRVTTVNKNRREPANRKRRVHKPFT